MEPEKGKEKVASNHSQNTSITNMSLPRPKSFTKEQSIPSETAANSSSLLEKAWNGFSSAMESFIKWLCFGIEWPKDINSDMFARRTAVTGADLTCPADGVSWRFSCVNKLRLKPWACNHRILVSIAPFRDNFTHLHYNAMQRAHEAISGYFVIFARNCLAFVFSFIVMQM